MGGDKRLHFARFLRELSAGARPHLVVVGGAATGKSVLLEGVQGALPESLLLNLSHDLSPTLFMLAETLGVTGAYERLSAQLSPRQPFSQSAALQEELRRTLAAHLNAAGRPLLLRAEARATLGGTALRGAGGEEVPLAAWLEPLLRRLEIPYLAALSEPPPQLPFQPLRPPSRREAQLRRDPALQDVLQVLSARSPEADPAVPIALLEALLGRPTTALAQAEGALLEPLHDGFVKPVLWALQLAAAADAFYSAHLEGATARLEEARYRARRTRYRLAVAYFVWATGDPYCPPFRSAPSGSRPTGRIEALLRELLSEVAPLAGSADRYASLHLDVACALALVLPAPQALGVLRPLLNEVPDYLKATLQLALTEAWLRAGETAEAGPYLARLHTLPPDPGLWAWRAALEAELLLALGQGDLACDVIGEALTLPRAFRAQLGRVWGQLLVAYEQEALAERWVGSNPSWALALPEALALHFHSEAPCGQRSSQAA